MKKLQFTLPEYKQLEINGHVFDILKADADILEKAQGYRNKYSKFAGKQSVTDEDLREVVAAIKDIISYIDEILGAGAVKKIVQERPLSIADAIQLLSMVCKGVIEEYNASIKDKYDDTGDE